MPWQQVARQQTLRRRRIRRARSIPAVRIVAGDGERGFKLNVRTMIKRLRRKFQAIDPDFQAIRSIAGLGYAWDASQ